MNGAWIIAAVGSASLGALSMAYRGTASDPNLAHAVSQIEQQELGGDYSGPYDSERVGVIAAELDAPEYFVLPDQSEIEVNFGWLVEIGEESARIVSMSETLVPGLYQNVSDGSVTIQTGSYVFTELAQSGLVLICTEGNVRGDLNGLTKGSIPANGAARVICRDGYYACCKFGPPLTAKCVKNNTPAAPDCDAGGPGSSECEIKP